MQTRISQLKGDRGQALVELALVIPLLLILLFGIIDFGLALNQYNDTTNLANLGARAAAVASATGTTTDPTCTNGSLTSTSLTSYLQCEGSFDSSALGSGHLLVCPQDTSGSTWAEGDTIQVTVADVFNWLQILVGGVGRLGGSVAGPTTTIASTATMREEAAGNTTIPGWISTNATSTNGTGC